MIIYIALAGIIMALIGWWRPMVAAALLSLLWPAYLVRTSVAGVPTTLLEIAIYGAGLGILVSVLAHRWPRPKIHLSCMTMILTLAWSVAWIIATITSPDHRESLGALKAWWFDPLVYVAILFVTVRTASERLFLVRSAILSGAIVAFAGLYQLAFVRDTLQEGRLSSFFTPVANYAAMYLAPLFIVTLALNAFGILRRAWWWLTGLLALALVGTLSYGGFAAVGVGAIIVWFFLPPSVWRRRVLYGAIIVAVAGVAFLTTTKNFHQHFDAGRSSGEVRKQIWVTSWALIAKHPIFGIGPNAFQVAYQTELPKHYFPPLEWLVAQPHNLYLALWLETGLLGLLAALASFVYFFAQMKKLIRDPAHRPYVVAALAAIAAILVHGAVDTPILKNDLMLITVALLSLPWLGQQEKI